MFGTSKLKTYKCIAHLQAVSLDEKSFKQDYRLK